MSMSRSRHVTAISQGLLSSLPTSYDLMCSFFSLLKRAKLIAYERVSILSLQYSYLSTLRKHGSLGAWAELMAAIDPWFHYTPLSKLAQCELCWNA
jgi:hypothetical protein